MSDLNDQLMHLATDAAGRARPAAVTEVIRRGNRRRTRTITQRSVSGLCALGIGAAAILSTMAGQHSTGQAPAASGSGTKLTTITEHTTSPGWNMTTTVTYRDERNGRIQIYSLTFSGWSKLGLKRPADATISASRLYSNKASIAVIQMKVKGTHDFSGELSPSLIKSFNSNRGFAATEIVTINLPVPNLDKISGKHASSGSFTTGLVLI